MPKLIQGPDLKSSEMRDGVVCEGRMATVIAAERVGVIQEIKTKEMADIVVRKVCIFSGAKSYVCSRETAIVDMMCVPVFSTIVSYMRLLRNPIWREALIASNEDSAQRNSRTSSGLPTQKRLERLELCCGNFQNNGPLFCDGRTFSYSLVNA